MASLFITLFLRSAKVFFFRAVKLGFTYEQIREIFLAEYSSDTFKLQDHRYLQQLSFFNVIIEKYISDVGKRLLHLVAVIEELILQYHPELQTDHHKFLYLSDAIYEVLKWWLHPVVNIKAHRYTLNRYVTTLNDSVQAKVKVRMMRGEADRIIFSFSVLLNTHIGQYSCSLCQVRHDHQHRRSTNPKALTRLHAWLFVSNDSRSVFQSTYVDQVQPVT